MRLKNIQNTLLVCVTALGYSSLPEAALIDRGGGLIYDDILDVTWLQDPNYALTSGTDPDSTLDGRMVLSDANTWISNLTYFDTVRGVTYDDWRLPDMDINNDGTVVDCSSGGQTACQDNEYGHMYYYGGGSILGGGITASDPGPFDAFGVGSLGRYWSGTPGTQSLPSSYSFSFTTGNQLDLLNSSLAYVWAVRDGNVIPIPAAVWLFGSGLIALIGIARRKKS